MYILGGLLVNILLQVQVHSFLTEDLQLIFAILQDMIDLSGPIQWLQYSSETNTLIVPIVIYEV